MKIYLSRRVLSYISVIIPVALCSLLPLLMSSYYISFVALTFMYIALALSWNFFSGYTGYWSFGHNAFFGIGAYSVAVAIVRFGFPKYLSLIISGISAAILGITLGIVLLRLKGIYFAIALMVFADFLKVMFVNIKYVGGGPGILLPPEYALIPFYYISLGLVIISVLVSYFLKRSYVGYALSAMKDDEIAAQALGINTAKYRVLTLSLSSLVWGVMGGAFAIYMTYINPYSAFDDNLQLVAAVMTIFGGIGTVIGPLVGALVFSLIQEALWVTIPELYLIIVAATLILLLKFMPEGIVGRLTIFKSGKVKRRK